MNPELAKLVEEQANKAAEYAFNVLWERGSGGGLSKLLENSYRPKPKKCHPIKGRIKTS